MSREAEITKTQTQSPLFNAVIVVMPLYLGGFRSLFVSNSDETFHFRSAQGNFRWHLQLIRTSATMNFVTLTRAVAGVYVLHHRIPTNTQCLWFFKREHRDAETYDWSTLRFHVTCRIRCSSALVQELNGQWHRCCSSGSRYHISFGIVNNKI